MKTKNICANYGLNQNLFDRWLRQSSNIPFKHGMVGGISIENESDIEEAVTQFQQHQAEIAELAESKKAEEERVAQEKQLAAEKKQKALASMLVTSGFSFDGYKITKYSGYISGDDVVQIDRGTHGLFSQVTDVGESLMTSLADIRRNALAELKEAAYNLDCNAVIGVDFDYLTLDPETAHSGGGTMYLPYVFGVTANGNAVIIEED